MLTDTICAEELLTYQYLGAMCVYASHVNVRFLFSKAQLNCNYLKCLPLRSATELVLPFLLPESRT